MVVFAVAFVEPVVVVALLFVVLVVVPLVLQQQLAVVVVYVVVVQLQFDWVYHQDKQQDSIVSVLKVLEPFVFHAVF